MSTIVERIGEYAGALQSADIDAKVADYAKRILLDSLACGYGGLESEPAKIVRKGIGRAFQIADDLLDHRGRRTRRVHVGVLIPRGRQPVGGKGGRERAAVDEAEVARSRHPDQSGLGVESEAGDDVLRRLALVGEGPSEAREELRPRRGRMDGTIREAVEERRGEADGLLQQGAGRLDPGLVVDAHGLAPP